MMGTSRTRVSAAARRTNGYRSILAGAYENCFFCPQNLVAQDARNGPHPMEADERSCDERGRCRREATGGVCHICECTAQISPLSECKLTKHAVSINLQAQNMRNSSDIRALTCMQSSDVTHRDEMHRHRAQYVRLSASRNAYRQRARLNRRDSKTSRVASSSIARDRSRRSPPIGPRHLTGMVNEIACNQASSPSDDMRTLTCPGV